MHDIKISAAALRAASNWAMDGVNAAPVELFADGGVLFVNQGDDHVAYDSSGTVVESSSVELVEPCSCTLGAATRHGGGTTTEVVRFDPDCPVHTSEPLNQHLLTRLEILREVLRDQDELAKDGEAYLDQRVRDSLRGLLEDERSRRLEAAAHEAWKRERGEA